MCPDGDPCPVITQNPLLPQPHLMAAGFLGYNATTVMEAWVLPARLSQKN